MDFDICIADQVYRCSDRQHVFDDTGCVVELDALNGLLSAVCSAEGHGTRRCTHGAGVIVARSKTLVDCFDVTFPNGKRITVKAEPINACALLADQLKREVEHMRKRMAEEVERIREALRKEAEVNNYGRFDEMVVTIDWSHIHPRIRRYMINKVMKKLVEDPNIQDRIVTESYRAFGDNDEVATFSIDTSYSLSEFAKVLASARDAVFDATKTLRLPHGVHHECEWEKPYAQKYRIYCSKKPRATISSRGNWGVEDISDLRAPLVDPAPPRQSPTPMEPKAHEAVVNNDGRFVFGADKNAVRKMVVTINWSHIPPRIRTYMINKVMKKLVEDPNIQDRIVTESFGYNDEVATFSLDTSYSQSEFEKAFAGARDAVFDATSVLECEWEKPYAQKYKFECQNKPRSERRRVRCHKRNFQREPGN